MFHKNDLFHTSLSFDMRVPDFGVPPREAYAAAFEMIDYADRHGIDRVDFQEHHQSEDGYLPAPFLMGTAAAARTKTIAVVMGAAILPFHDPVKIAEQIAVADLISGGRFYTVLAAGYAEHEFAAFGITLKDRGRLMERGFEVILRALSGERFMDGTREVFVRPLPQRDVREILYAGGGSPAAARRAARFRLSMWPMNNRIIRDYEAECAALGHEPGRLMRPATSVYVTDDPDKAWHDIAPYILHYVRSYAAWSGDAAASASPMHGLDTLDKIKASGVMQVVTPEQAVAIGRVRGIGLCPLIGGMTPELGWASLEMFVGKVLPAIRDAPAEWRAAVG